MKDNTMATQTTFKQLELSQLRANKSNIRTELTDIEELADSIKAQGLLQPLLVTPHPEVEGDYLVIGGHRRLAASTAAGLLTVPCMVAEGFESLPEQIEAMLSENTHRSNLTVVEEADAYQQLLDFPGYTVEKIAKKTGRSESTVRRRVALIAAGEQVLDAVKEQKIDLFQAEEIAKYAGEDDLVKDLTAAAESGQDWKWESAKSSAEKALQWRQEYPKVYEHLTKLGYDFIDEAEADSNAFKYVRPIDLPGLSWKPSELLEVTSRIIPADILAEHGKDGLRPCFSHRTRSVGWYVPAPKKVKGSAPEPTAEELAEKAARERAETALRIDCAAAQKYLEERVQSPVKVKGAAHKALAFFMANSGAEAPEYARLLGAEVDTQELSYVEKREAYFDAFLAFTADQLATAMALEVIGSSDGFKRLFRLDELSPSMWDFKMKQSKLGLLSEVYGLEESTGLRLAREYWEPALPGTADAEAPAPVEDEVNF
ncbi:MAG TPA: hypothetical protein DIS77_08100 [Rothia sp.]|nr:hypothetical protein [Rothia sp. (in: high G+C Gram-positive bacteria)]